MNEKPTKFVDTVAAAALCRMTVEGVDIAARSGRIPGAIRHGSVRRGAWLIPLNATGGVDIIGRRKVYAPRAKLAHAAASA